MLNDLNDFIFPSNGKILGNGAFSKVIKITSKIDREEYALKKIDISKLSKSDCQNLKREIALHKPL